MGFQLKVSFIKNSFMSLLGGEINIAALLKEAQFYEGR
jgi:hypothetical protein